MHLVRKLLSIPKVRRRILIEAAWSLILARMMLRCIPFKRIEKYLSRRATKLEITGPTRDLLCRDARSAVERIAELLPGSTVCFPRAIAVQSMLRRRGVSTTLYYGARDDGSLSAHVWIQDGNVGVIGMPGEGEYRVVAKVPYQA